MRAPALPPRKRVAFVNTHPIQYFAPLYRCINQSEDIEAVPVYLTKHGLRHDVDPGFGQAFNWDIDLLSGTDPVFVSGADSRTLETGVTKMLAPGIWNVIRSGSFDAVVIHGHRIGANHVATLAAKSLRIPVFSRGETHLGLPRSSAKLALRKALFTGYYGALDGFLAIGTLNREFYRAMGVPESKLFDFPYTVDNDRFVAAALLTADERRAERARLGITDDRPIVLYASKFTPRKHPDHLIQAQQILRSRGLDFHLVLAGAGEMEGDLRALAAANPDLSIHFPGFFNQSELPRLFGACDIFSLPAEAEPWGLIINEAMCAGLPIVASDEIGSVVDLVQSGVNGATHRAGDIQGIAAALEILVANPAAIKTMGQASRDRIGQWSYDRCVIGLRNALHATARPAREPRA